MLNFIDNILNRITMYRLILYNLIFLEITAMVLGAFHVLPYNPWQIFFSTAFILAVCLIANKIFAAVFEAPTNVESVYITALILVLLITPARGLADAAFYSIATWASLWAIASKFIFAIKRKHIFNPAAFGVALTALVLGQSASWWVGTAVMAPFVVFAGLLMARKIIRFDLVLSTVWVALVAIVAVHLGGTSSIFDTVARTLLDSPLLFFAFVMVTEPLTAPPTENLRLWYGALVGALFSPAVHIGTLYSTPELALLAGNVFSYLVSSKTKLVLKLKQKIQLSPDSYDYIFQPDRKLKFAPGQYLEWTLGHKNSDSRGNRRYFTIASSPTEPDIHLGVKFYEPASSFKKKLSTMKVGDTLVASQLAGDFTLPKKPEQKIVFIAGGIGITPFRSMIKYLIDNKDSRQVVLFYANKTPADAAYGADLADASKYLNLKTIHVFNEASAVPKDWQAYQGLLNVELIEEQVPDWRACQFYISGPRGMVVGFKKTMSELGLPPSQIKTDYFPGFA